MHAYAAPMSQARISGRPRSLACDMKLTVLVTLTQALAARPAVSRARDRVMTIASVHDEMRMRVDTTKVGTVIFRFRKYGIPFQTG